MQMRTIRAYLLRAEEGELVSQVVAGDYVTPKVLCATQLIYEFAEICSNVSIVRFEILDTYGPELTKESCTISLFSQSVKPDLPCSSGPRIALHQSYCKNTIRHMDFALQQASQYSHMTQDCRSRAVSKHSQLSNSVAQRMPLYPMLQTDSCTNSSVSSGPMSSHVGSLNS